MSGGNEVEKCLICSQNNKIMISLQEVLTGYEFSIAEVLKNLHFLTISDDVNLHRTLCFLCVAKIQTCFEFKKVCGQIENVLRMRSNSPIFESTIALPIISTLKTVKEEQAWDSDEEEHLEEDPIQSYDQEKVNGRNTEMDIGTAVQMPNISIYSDTPNNNYDIINEEKAVFIKEEKQYDEISTDNHDFEKPFEDIHENIENRTFENTSLNIEFPNQIPIPSSSSDTNIANIAGGMLQSNRTEFLFNFQRNIRKNSKRNPNSKKSFSEIKERKHVCDICDKAFSRGNHLSAHKLTHTGGRAYVCDICDKTFSQPGNLTTHKLIHAGIKPYTCEFCNKSFTQSGNLNSHRLIHTGERPFICEFCNKSFNQSSSLNTHKLLHTGERPYPCGFCSKSFTTSSCRSKHVTAIHTK